MRTCYQCEKPIEDIEGNYWCDDECKKKWQEDNYGGRPKSLKRNDKITIEEIQAKLLKLAIKANESLF